MADILTLTHTQSMPPAPYITPQQQRNALNHWVATRYKALNLPPLPSMVTQLDDYLAERCRRMQQLQALKPQYPHAATAQDWHIAIANAVR